MAKTPTVQMYHIIVHIDPAIHPSELHSDDRSDPLLYEGGQLAYLAFASDEEAAGELALDHFHDHNAIKVLDDFSIYTTVRTLSNHEKLAMLDQYPHVSHKNCNWVYTIDHG